jgi:hypothetical protein
MSMPAQGFWNLLVYIRPRFIKYRSDHPGTTIWGTLKAILYDQYKANIDVDTETGSSTVHESDDRQDYVEKVAEDGSD